MSGDGADQAAGEGGGPEFLSGDDYPQPSNPTVSLLGRNAALFGILSTVLAYGLGAPNDAGLLADAILLAGSGAYLGQVAFMFLYPELCREEAIMQLSQSAMIANTLFDRGPYLLYTGIAALVLAGLNVLFVLF